MSEGGSDKWCNGQGMKGGTCVLDPLLRSQHINVSKVHYIRSGHNTWEDQRTSNDSAKPFTVLCKRPPDSIILFFIAAV